MSASQNNKGPRGEDLGSDSHGTIDLFLDGPGDTTVRPCRPELRNSAEAERAKLLRWGGLEGKDTGSKPQET
jgi:hypothetical protein